MCICEWVNQFWMLSGFLTGVVVTFLMVLMNNQSRYMDELSYDCSDNKGPSIDTKHLVDTDHVIEHLWDSPS